MRKFKKTLALFLSLCLTLSLSVMSASASTFVDAHGNTVELNDTLEAYSSVVLSGANDAARKGETNLGDLWTDALRWFAVSGKINGYFEEDDIAAGNTKIDADADHIVALWNGGNLRADIAEGKFGATELAKVLPYPNKVAVVYMTGAQLLESLETAAQGLPYGEASAAACASFMQVSGLRYSVNADKAFDKGDIYKEPWSKAASVQRVSIESVNEKAFDASAVYAVITSSANFNGMDSSYIFKAASTADERSAITTAVVRDVVWMYIDEQLGHIVGETYAAAQGRITVHATEQPTAPVQPSAPVQPAEPATPWEGSMSGEYVVVRGDSLWKIASKVYGSGSLWGNIFRANPQVKDASLIYVGQKLVIPAK